MLDKLSNSYTLIDINFKHSFDQISQRHRRSGEFVFTFLNFFIKPKLLICCEGVSLLAQIEENHSQRPDISLKHSSMLVLHHLLRAKKVWGATT